MRQRSSPQVLQFQREKTGLKYFLIGRQYYGALRALGYVERYNVGFRKDGVTPSLHHEIQIALSVTQLKDVALEERCLIAALLHDVQEDHQIPSEDIEKVFGVDTRNDVWGLTKKFAGVHKSKKEYIDVIASCCVLSIVKGLDRCNNLNSMIGVFTIQKMEEYAKEAETIFLPMLKKAGKLFPEQQAAYLTISQEMKRLIAFTYAYVKAIRDRDEIIKEKAAEIAKRDIEYVKIIHARDAEIASAKQTAEFKPESTCETARNKAACLKALDALKVLHLSDSGQVKAMESLCRAFGVSQLDLTVFSDKVTEAIGAPTTVKTMWAPTYRRSLEGR